MSTPVHCLRRPQEPRAPGDEKLPEEQTGIPLEEREAIVCRQCSNPVTRGDAAIQVAGAHRHTFFNPVGVVFEIACYESAPGSSDEGEATTHFTWFPGYGWRFSFCAACRSHLGWQFVSGAGESFWGLIVSRLVGA